MSYWHTENGYRELTDEGEAEVADQLEELTRIGNSATFHVHEDEQDVIIKALKVLWMFPRCTFVFGSDVTGVQWTFPQRLTCKVKGQTYISVYHHGSALHRTIEWAYESLFAGDITNLADAIIEGIEEEL